MISRYRVAIGGTQLDSLDDNLLILDIQHSPVEKQIRQSSVANLDGYEIADTKYIRRTITVTFELHIYDIAERNAVCQKINAWAKNGGTMTVSDREGQRIIVACEQLADIESARNWTDPLTLVFSSTYSPFWETVAAKTVTLAGKTAKGTLKMDGNAGDALVSVTVTAKAAVSSLQLTVGDCVLKLTGLSVAADKQIVVDYVRQRLLRIRADGKSVLAKLDPASTDNLRAACGADTAIAVTANNSVTAVFTARGRWM